MSSAGPADGSARIGRATTYSQLPALKSAQYIGCIEGPSADEKSEQLRVPGRNDVVACGQTVSTYPLINIDPAIRAGDPVCDRFACKLYADHAFVAVADGCGWGNRPYQAANVATNAFITYLEENRSELDDIQNVGRQLLLGFDLASRKILEGKDTIWEAGSTTLIGGVVLPDADAGSNGSGPPFHLVACSVGDCKGYIWRAKDQSITDFTLGNRDQVLHSKDPGGRLGPSNDNGDPDLRNLCLYHVPVEMDDLIVLVSDGVHDNLDPEVIGKLPTDLGGTEKDWKSTSPVWMNKTKAAFANQKLSDILDEVLKKSSHDSMVTDLTQAIVEFSIAITKVGRDWMEQNPGKKQPEDYVLYPGKMDHVTCLVYRVGHGVVSGSTGSDGDNGEASSAGG